MKLKLTHLSSGARCIISLSLLVLFSGLLSCSWFNKEFGPAPDTANSEVEQPRDIPVPEDANFQKSQSYLHYPSGRKARVAKFIYYSDESIKYLEKFYRNNMKYGWEKAAHNPEGKGKLNFVSSNELCMIRMEKLPEIKQRRLKKSVKIKIEIEPVD